MTQNDVFKEYVRLVKQMVAMQDKVSSSLDKTLTELDKERNKYNASFLVKHRTLIIAVFAPVIVITTIALIAWLFVSTGHPIELHVPGGYQITSKP